MSEFENEKNILCEPSMEYGATYTYADYLTWNVKERFEILKGRLFKMSPAPYRLHQDVSRNMEYHFIQFFKNKKCKVYDAPFDVRFRKIDSDKDEDIDTVFQPDICVICDLEKLDKRGCLGAPDLIVEILSPGNSKKEMKQKFEIYQEYGVREYWMVDYEAKTVLIYVLEDGIYKGLKILTEDETAISVIFPDLEVPLNEVFQE